MSANYVLLETIQVGEAGASSVTFNNIPQSGYTDLKIVVSGRASSTAQADWQLLVKFNGSSTGYSSKTLWGSGTNAYSFSTTIAGYSGVTNGGLSTANTFSNCEVYIPNYTSSNYKSFFSDTVIENNTTATREDLNSMLWSNTAAITTITIAPETSNWVQYSTFSLYGLAAVGTTPVVAPYASGGDIIQTDGTYWYHAFLSSGTFTPTKNLSCDYVIVGGGGGGGSGTGGNQAGGGGGAGGYLTSIGGSAAALLSNSNYSITIGAGGAATGVAGSNGNNSIISGTGLTTVTAYGGGGGGYGSNATGLVGASGGGGTPQNGAGGGVSPSGQGNAGGYGRTTAGTGGGGGGGGAGAVGGSTSGSAGGVGGAGLYSTLTDAAGALLGVGQLSSTHYYFAGGGGGGAEGTTDTGAVGGVGGGGHGGGVGLAAAIPNTGGGGGGGAGTGTNDSTKGGSGIVIVRYAI